MRARFAFSPGNLFRLVGDSPTTRGIPSQMIQTVAITTDSHLSPNSWSGGNSKIGKSRLRECTELRDWIWKLLQKVLLRQLFHDEFDEPIDYFFCRFRIE